MKSYNLSIFCICLLTMLAPSTSLKSQVSLNDYMEMAVDSNPSVQAKYYEYLSVTEKVNQSGSIPDPTVSVAYGLSPVETRLGAQDLNLPGTLIQYLYPDVSPPYLVGSFIRSHIMYLKANDALPV